MRLAVWQGPSPAGDATAAFAVVEQMLTAAAAAGARMAVFPELFLPGYNSDAVAAQAQPADGAWAAALAGLARRLGCGLTIGFAERDGAAVYNSAIAIGADGARLGLYRKLQLYGPREARLFSPGNEHCLFDLDGRRAALMICYDVEFAPHVAALAARGAEVLLVPTANMLPFAHVPRLTVPAQAVNHAVSIAYANFCGPEGDLTYTGGSVIVGPDGVALAQAGPGPALLVADLLPVDPSRLSTQRADFRPIG